MKAVLLELTGDYPRTHSIRRLLGDVLRIIRDDDLREFAKRNRVRLLALEDAYLMARYFTREYHEEDAKDMVELAYELTALISRVLGGGKRGSHDPFKKG